VNPPAAVLEVGLDLVQKSDGVFLGAPIVDEDNFEALRRVVLRLQRLESLVGRGNA
jgi:hypothetical protein